MGAFVTPLLMISGVKLYFLRAVLLFAIVYFWRWRGSSPLKKNAGRVGNNVVIAHSPFGPAGRLDYRRHAISIKALGLGEVDHVENDSLKRQERTIKPQINKSRRGVFDHWSYFAILWWVCLCRVCIFDRNVLRNADMHQLRLRTYI